MCSCSVPLSAFHQSLDRSINKSIRWSSTITKSTNESIFDTYHSANTIKEARTWMQRTIHSANQTVDLWRWCGFQLLVSLCRNSSLHQDNCIALLNSIQRFSTLIHDLYVGIPTAPDFDSNHQDQRSVTIFKEDSIIALLSLISLSLAQYRNITVPQFKIVSSLNHSKYCQIRYFINHSARLCCDTWLGVPQNRGIRYATTASIGNIHSLNNIMTSIIDCH